MLGAAEEGTQGCEKASTVLAVLQPGLAVLAWQYCNLAWPGSTAIWPGLAVRQPGLSCSAACVAHMLCDGLTDEIWIYAHML